MSRIHRIASSAIDRARRQCRVPLTAASPFCLLAFALAFPSSAGAQNRLADSQSPYLLQHADNPVGWYPWGEEAFKRAAAEDKLIFVSIGYSTCHWCHVMNRESFSDPEIAAYINSNYICIKVDREERPDIDDAFLTFVQTLRGEAGWPLNVWLTPDGKPFFGGSYFPPRHDPQRGPGLLETLTEIHEQWQADAHAIRQSGATLAAALSKQARSPGSDPTAQSLNILPDAIASFYWEFDEANGGLGIGEKFPFPTALSMLLRVATFRKLTLEDRELSKRMALKSLDAIIHGGLRDHVGGGFHRYTVDPGWKLPHFEKMLHDQALMVRALVDAWQLTGESRYREAATETLEFVLREMRSDQGAFYSAQDAESANAEDLDTKAEGIFYLWRSHEFDRLFPDQKRRLLARAYFSVTVDGNAPITALPGQAFSGYNTLRLETDLATLARDLQLPLDQAQREIEAIKRLLFEERSQRPRPALDDKIIASWNGLAISAFARAAQAFERSDYADAAARTATFLLDRLYDRETRRLARLYRQGASTIEGFAEDYAYVIEGLLDLYEATADHKWIQQAEALQSIQDELFLDSNTGGYALYRSSDYLAIDYNPVQSDQAMPSARSISVKNLWRLAQTTDSSSYRARAESALSSLSGLIASAPTSSPETLETIAFLAKKPMQIVIAGDPQSTSFKSMLRVVNQRLLPNRFVLYADHGEGQRFLGERLEFILAASAHDGLATAYLCENYICQMPTRDPAMLAAQIDRLSDPSDPIKK